MLVRALEMIDNGECDGITPEEVEMLSEIIHRPQSMGREDAAKYLGLSLNRFHELRDCGVIPDPRKRRGFKEKEYFKCDLDKAKEYLLRRCTSRPAVRSPIQVPTRDNTGTATNRNCSHPSEITSTS